MTVSMLRWTAFALALVGAILSNALLGLHARGTSDLGLLEGICGKGGAGCNAVISSRFGVFPPAPAAGEPVPPAAAPPDGAPAPAVTPQDGAAAPALTPPPASPPAPKGFPVAALGLFWMTLLTVWFAAIGRPTGSRRPLAKAILGLHALGLVASLFYLAVMLFVIDGFCVLCLGTHLANFAIAPILWRLRPPPPAPPPAAGAKGPPAAPAPDHPGLALGLTALALVAALWMAEWKSYRAASAGLQSGQVEELRAALDELNRDLARYSEIASDIERLDGLHLDQAPLELGVRPDDPKIDGGRGQRMQVVVFSDIECPNCARFHAFLFGEMIPLFAGHLEVVFKHFPLSEHANALPGAKALEAARRQGNERYWQLHHWLAERREQLGSVDWSAAAQAVGLDGPRFLADMASPETMKRIQEDIARGKALGITGTPAVYLNGRPVNRVIRSNIGWWKLKADMLRDAREKANQPW